SQTDDGSRPWSVPLMDKAGNLYGVTTYGGGFEGGTVFKVTPAGVETVLYSFGTLSSDGYYPGGTVVMDKSGNLYGTTNSGGAYDEGTVYQLAPDGTETTLYNFGNQSGDGAYSQAGLVRDTKGNLYGVNEAGPDGCGTVFKVTQAGTETILHTFGSQAGDGCLAGYGQLVRDGKGNLYGTTRQGGANNVGTVFKVTRKGVESVLYSFGSQSGDGNNPYGPLIMDKQGNLYGATVAGGVNGDGTVYKVTPSGSETVLFSFSTQSGEGYSPYGSLVMDKTGNLYGTTLNGGMGNGTVYKLTPSGVESTIYSFGSQAKDGAQVFMGLTKGKKGNLYGTAASGGAFGEGTVFRVTP
ncbi:MAG: choice-of-anchor tandem repeat GloVer-containing protein, partial [Terriglobales bacterium]